MLDGMAIADEFHAPAPDGSPCLGISLRHFDARQGAWIIEYLNVTGSFLRRQVNARSGSVQQEGATVVVVSHDGQARIRERYDVKDREHFTYGMERSGDEGRSWGPVLLEMWFERVE